MMKNKQCLKEEVMNLYPSHSEMYEYPDDLTVEKVDLINNFIDLIDQLDEPETLNEEWINEHSKAYTMENSVEISDLKNLLLPQPKKPVIPKFVADWIESYRDEGGDTIEILGSLTPVFVSSSFIDNKVIQWFKKNTDKMLNSLINGYEVEKEKKYQVELPTERLHHILTMHVDGKGHFFGKEHTNNFWYRTYLTEQEIKAIDERFWVFAEEVTE